ncbi:hypothetical protein EB796_001799 [Bugula neritina]|uniref:Uncharacterized protein n=1 Tax=Bugula neritina TaxID=10212 RepID=A0A7J7KP64_BUGNE|nr:hypothetical protein EB796_001799 [Bugula neritina]
MNHLLGYLLSLVLRLLAGDYLLGIPTIIKYPFYRADIDLQLFPFRTFAMISSILVSVLFSFLAKVTLTRLSKGWDVLRLVHPHWLKLRTELRKSELSTPPVDEKNILESAETFTHL